MVVRLVHGNMELGHRSQRRLEELGIHPMALEQSLVDSIMSEMVMQHLFEEVCIMKLQVVVT